MRVVRIMLIVLALFGLVQAVCAQKSEVTKEKTKLLAVGATAPDWELKDLEGNLQTLAQYHGKIVVLDFWATWCGSLRGSYAANAKVA